jgi:hypothetical protein
MAANGLSMVRHALIVCAISLFCVSVEGGWQLQDWNAFSNRSDFTLTSWGSAVWLTGGGNYSSAYSLFNDIYVTYDGATWRQVLQEAPWTARAYHAAEIVGGSLMISGGGRCDTKNFNSSLCPDYGWFNDIWTTTDGVKWQQLQTTGNIWAPRGGHSMNLMPDGSIIVCGGLNSTFQYNDVWVSTTQGSTWQQVLLHAPWTNRSFHGTAVIRDTLVLAGGADFTVVYNDVWTTKDGATWTQVLASAAWSPRYAFGFTFVPPLAAGNGTLWVTGGCDLYPNIAYADVWTSTDGGNTWIQHVNGTWSPRSFHATAALTPADVPNNRSLVLAGGWNVIGLYTYHYLSDAWSLPV